MSNLLLDERPVVIQPSLVRRFDLPSAAILQQLHYWAHKSNNLHDGHTWVYKTYQDWGDEIGITVDVARRALERLRDEKIVVAINNPTDSRDRTRWWRIDYRKLGSPDHLASTPDQLAPAPSASGAQASSRARVPSGPSDPQGDVVQPENTTENARERAGIEEKAARLGFDDWLADHASVTSRSMPKAGTRTRRSLASAYVACHEELAGNGIDPANGLRNATRVAFADEFRRERGHFGAESVLRVTKIVGLAERKPAQPRASQGYRGDVIDESLAARLRPTEAWDEAEARERLKARREAERQAG